MLRKLALKEATAASRRKTEKGSSYMMQEHMMRFLAPLMNGPPEGESGTRVAPTSIVAFAPCDCSAVGGADTGGCDDDDSE